MINDRIQELQRIAPPVTRTTLRITEIFCSLQGESRTVGYPTIFIRLTGCPLRCEYCDTAYAFQGGEKLSVADILEEVASLGAKHVTVTGGEPLAQKSCITLLALLCDRGYEVSLETSGALDISEIDTRVSKVMDIKTPASGESSRNLLSNLAHLSASDQIKFVISDRLDYNWSKSFIENHHLAGHCEILFSPVYGRMPSRELADWIVADRLPVRFQIQLHKLLWGDERAR